MTDPTTPRIRTLGVLLLAASMLSGLLPSPILRAAENDATDPAAESYRPDAYSVHTPITGGRTNAQISTPPQNALVDGQWVENPGLVESAPGRLTTSNGIYSVTIPTDGSSDTVSVENEWGTIYLLLGSPAALRDHWDPDLISLEVEGPDHAHPRFLHTVQTIPAPAGRAFSHGY